MRGYKGPDYKALSEEAVLHQVRINLLYLSSVSSFVPLLNFLMMLCIRLWPCGVGLGQSIF